jgi:hypothetical protein
MGHLPVHTKLFKIYMAFKKADKSLICLKIKLDVVFRCARFCPKTSVTSGSPIDE